MSRVVVVSNRVSLPKEDRAPRGGLAVGVMAALQETGGLWFGWDGNVVGPHSEAVQQYRTGAVEFAVISLTREQYDDYYLGYANRVIWPLFHGRVDLVEYQHRYAVGYERVNRTYAVKLVRRLGTQDLIWVHDYHLIPLAKELHYCGAENPMGFFLHIPFPPLDILRTLPNYRRLLLDLCAYNLLGFQTDLDLHAFEECVRLDLKGRFHAGGWLEVDGRWTRVGVFPIGIDVDDVVSTVAEVREGQHNLRLQQSLMGRSLIMGVDRLDYSKGLVSRFRAVERLLTKYPEYQSDVVLMQIAQPSRDEVPEYQDILGELETVAGQINGRYAEYDWMPIRYLNKSFDRSTVLGFLSLADIGLVTPLRDGMNLVAKEFIATQDPGDPGILVLSKMAGAARELDSVIQVNPYDLDDMADGLAKAACMGRGERIERWTSAMATLRKNDISAWRDRFLNTLKQSGSGPVISLSEPQQGVENFLLGDIGGTFSRFGLYSDKRGLHAVEQVQNAEFPGLGEAIAGYLRGTGGPSPQAAALAVAAPVAGDAVQLTNLGWEFSQRDLERQFHFQSLSVMNDFKAVALAVPYLDGKAVLPIGEGCARPHQPVAVLGPGTGFGVSGLVPGSGVWVAIEGEGGHVSLATAEPREQEVWARMMARYGHVSAERVLSGPGILEMYSILCEAAEIPVRLSTPQEVAGAARDRSDPLAMETMGLFFTILGRVAGDIALTLGARGGVYLAGGILGKMTNSLQESGFREAFVNKGRYRDYLRNIPTFLILEPFPAFKGLLHHLGKEPAREAVTV